MERQRDRFIYTKKTWESIDASKITYVLSDRTKRIIQKITKQVTSSTYRKKPNLKRQVQHHKHRTYNVVKHDNIEYVPQIRGLLNKITESNMISLTDEMMMKMELVTKDDINAIVEFIFNIASRNRFYSNQYAYVYHQFSQKYTYIEELFRKSLQQLIPNILKCVDVDSNVDYEGFCEMNKTNEKNRAFVHFIMNVFQMNQNHDIKLILMDVVETLCNTLTDTLYKENNVNTCHEITQVLYIILGHDNRMTMFDDIFLIRLHASMNDILNLDKNKCLSYSNKMKFKIMDLTDVLDKNKLNGVSSKN